MMDLEQLRNELVDACAWGEEDRARALVSQLGEEPQARALLEAMFQEPDARARQAAAFGLGLLGGSPSVRVLEQQLALEEARGDYDGESVVEEIVRALSRFDDEGAGAALARRLERLAATDEPEPGDVNVLADSLWKRRSPGLLPVVRGSLARMDSSSHGSLSGLLVLLEKSPEELRAWALSPSVSLEDKTRVVTVLGADLPESLVSTLPSFIASASAVLEAASGQQGESSYYCDRLFSLFLLHKERLLPLLAEETRAELRSLARGLVPSVDPNCSFGAAVVLQHVGLPEDAALIEAHRPEDPIGARSFEDIARSLRQGRS